MYGSPVVPCCPLLSPVVLRFSLLSPPQADSLRVATTAGEASKMFECDFHAYGHPNGAAAQTRVIAVGTHQGRLTVPTDVRQHIHLVAGLTELWHGRAGKSKKQKPSNVSVSAVQAPLDDTDIKITPSVLRDYYNIPSNESNAGGDKNLQAIGKKRRERRRFIHTVC